MDLLRDSTPYNFSFWVFEILLGIIIPAILPGLLIVLRMNLFAAWMVVLVAETTGVGYGMGVFTASGDTAVWPNCFSASATGIM